MITFNELPGIGLTNCAQQGQAANANSRQTFEDAAGQMIDADPANEAMPAASSSISRAGGQSRGASQGHDTHAFRSRNHPITAQD